MTYRSEISNNRIEEILGYFFLARHSQEKVAERLRSVQWIGMSTDFVFSSGPRIPRSNWSEEISPYPHSHHNLSHLHNLSLFKTHDPKKHILTLLSPNSHSLSLETTFPPMATVSSTNLSCSYALSGVGQSELSKLNSKPSMASPVGSGRKLPLIRAQQGKASNSHESKGSEGRRAALAFLTTTIFASVAAASTSSANAGIIEEYLEKSKANKELNDKKRLATSGANFARAYTVQFGTCKFPENFTGCQDLAKQKKVPFLSDDLEVECEGKDKYKCGSNVFWKW